MSDQTPSADDDLVVAVVFLRNLEIQPDTLPSDKRLQIFTLGSFYLAFEGQRIPTAKWGRKQAVTTLKYLMAHLGRPIHREILMEFLWPDDDQDRAWSRLKVIIHSLRQELRATGLTGDVIETTNESYVLRREAVWVDSSVFESSVAEGKALQYQQRWSSALQRYEHARNLYKGDYLEEDVYADWCMVQREQLREIFLSLLAGMADCHSELGHHSEAAQVCRTALVFDPGRESFYRALMEHLVRLDRADWAIAEYQKCQKFLKHEFGMEPMPETERLYRQILKTHGRNRSDH
jgi:two-component SAPR family response regulator